MSLSVGVIRSVLLLLSLSMATLPIPTIQKPSNHTSTLPHNSDWGQATYTPTHHLLGLITHCHYPHLGTLYTAGSFHYKGTILSLWFIPCIWDALHILIHSTILILSDVLTHSTHTVLSRHLIHSRNVIRISSLITEISETIIQNPSESLFGVPTQNPRDSFLPVKTTF